MLPEHWDQVKQIFSTALGLPVGDQRAFLESACLGQIDVRRAVDGLLRAHHEASRDFLEPESIVFRAAWLFREGDYVGTRFRVVRPIARGAMGEVYQVYDERLRLHVALKAIRPELVGDADTAERFRREVLVTRDIAHEGLCRVFDLVEHPMSACSGFPAGTVLPCLTMQLLEGTSLEEWLATRRPMPPQDALPLVRQIAEALQVLHDSGVIHRDLKPSNVMLVSSESGTRAVLTDFGLARPLNENVFETKGALHGGAPFFMAPELFRHERPSRASDIYAFGLVIDEMVTATRAFPADSLHALLVQKLGGGPIRPSQRRNNMPRVWESAILRCLSPDPRDRFLRAEAVLHALEPNSASSQEWPRVRLLSQMLIPRRWRYTAYAATAVVALTTAAVGRPSDNQTSEAVLIVPFANLTGFAENDYLSTGTTAELGRRLSGLRDLRVYVSKDPAAEGDPAKLATFSLRGQVQQVGATLRLTAQLVNVADGTVVWSRNFEGPRERALDIENRLAAETALALTNAVAASHSRGPLHTFASLVGRNVPAASKRNPPIPVTSSNEAFDAYIRGRHLFEDRTLRNALAAVEQLLRAVALDPGFAAAYATLADVQGVLMDLHYAPHNQLLAQADSYARQAVALDENLPDAHLSLAAVRQMQSRWPEAETAYRRALELHPAFARAHRWLGGMLLQFARFDESLALFERALDLDPYDYPSQSAYGLALFYAGRPLEAATHLEGLIIKEDLLHAHLILGQIYAQLGKIDLAQRRYYLGKALEQSEVLRVKELEFGNRIGGTPPGRTEYADFVGALAWSYLGDRGAAEPYLNRLEQGREAGQVSPSVLARVYAVQQRGNDALDALEDAEGQQDRELMYLAVSPLYDHIRSESRFRGLLERKQLSR